MHLFFSLIFSGLHKFIKNPNQRTFLKSALMYGGKERYKKGTVRFNGFKFDVVDYLSFLFQYKDIFVDEYYRFKSESDSPLIYDCGSNIGTSCAYFKMIYPNSRIKAFEADPRISDVLISNIKNNKLTGIDVINKAVWISNDGVELSVEGADGASVYMKDNLKKVESVRLKDLLESESRVDMLKMDIEGGEIDVIPDCGSSLKVIDNLFIEYHSFTNAKQKLSELLKVLEQNNFRYFIKNDYDKRMPLVNKINIDNPNMDLQLNIFAYRK